MRRNLPVPFPLPGYKINGDYFSCFAVFILFLQMNMPVAESVACRGMEGLSGK